jgi:hypothetical protein
MGASRCAKGNAMRLTLSLFAAALLCPSIACAAPDKSAPLPSEVRLSDEDKEKVLEAAAAGRREPASAAANGVVDEEGAPRQVHGEVGFTVGTGGYRSAYGTAVVPLEGDGVAIISLGSTDFGRNRYPDPWWR